jgi:GntR family transcriptional regulator/MocR family aminotransferase
MTTYKLRPDRRHRVVRARRSQTGRIVNLALAPASSLPLYHQVYSGIRQQIIDGVLACGSLLPSSRALARDLCVSRNTVMLAYEQLRQEGYVEGRVRSATRVAPLPPERVKPGHPITERLDVKPHRGKISRRVAAVAAYPGRFPEVLEVAPRAFRAGVPAVDIFPVDIWGKLMARRWRRVPPRELSYPHPFGYHPLREVVASYLNAARGVRCTADQVIIVNGAQQGFDLASRVLLDPGDAVWLEDPGYHGARGAFTSAGAFIVEVPVDDDGLIVAEGIRRAPHARIAFVTPSRQVPLGVTLSPPRRQALLEWAYRSDAWIIEDDYDGEFRYVGRPLAALQGLDERGCVIYCGTFSKVTFPALRLGYLVIPPGLIDAFRSLRSFMDFASPTLQQAVMTDFIAGGHFERHLRKMRELYHERQQVLVAAAGQELEGLLEVRPADAGMTLLARLPEGMQDGEVHRAAMKGGVDVLPLSRFSSREMPPGLLLGYAGVRDWEIREGVTRLRQVLESRPARSA